MRVLHLLKTSVGAAWAQRQVRVLRGLGVEVHVALPEGPLVGAYESDGVTTHPGQFDLPVREPWRWPRVFRELRRLVTEIAPDVIHSHFVGTTLTMRLALGRKHGVPRVFQVPGPLHLEHRFFRRAEFATAGPRDYWIGSCKLTCRVYRRLGAEPGRVFLSYYGLDLADFENRRRGTLRAELKLHEDRPLAGMVAYMYPPKWYLGQRRGLKGHEDLIDAVAVCLRHRPGLVLAIAGGAWGDASRYERRVRAHARAACGDSVVFLGPRTDVPDLYPDFDVVVHPSHSENVGGAGESLLSAVPTIATTVGGFPDLIQPGETGWLVPPRRPRLLAASMLRVLDNPESAQAVARRGRALAREVMDVQTTARQVLDVYRNLAPAATVSDLHRRSVG